LLPTGEWVALCARKLCDRALQKRGVNCSTTELQMSVQWPDPLIPPPFRVADQQQVTLAHPPLVLATQLAPARTLTFNLIAAGGALNLPDGRRATSDAMAEENDLRIWRWPSGDRLQLDITRLEERPSLILLERGKDCRCLVVAGEPMLVELLEEATRPLYVAHVRGYLGEWATFRAAIRARTPAFRDRLLAGVATLSLESSPVNPIAP
jgi:hypothetical protein